MFTVLALPRPSLPSVLPPIATRLMLAAPTNTLALSDHCSIWPRLPAPLSIKKSVQKAELTTPLAPSVPSQPSPERPTEFRSPYSGFAVKNLSLRLSMPDLHLPSQYYCVRREKSADVFSSHQAAQTAYHKYAQQTTPVFLEKFFSLESLLESLGIMPQTELHTLRFYSVTRGNQAGIYTSRKEAKAAIQNGGAVGLAVAALTTLEQALNAFVEVKKQSSKVQTVTPLSASSAEILLLPRLSLVVVNQKAALFSQVIPKAACRLVNTAYDDVAAAYEALITHPHFDRESFMAPLAIEHTTQIHSYRLVTTKIPSALDQAEVNAVLDERLRHLQASDMWIFTDGSAQLDRIVASARLHSQTQKAEMSWLLETGFSQPQAALEAETLAANNALLEAMRRGKKLVRLFTDNLMVIQMTMNSAAATTPIQKQFLKTVTAFCQTGRLILTKVKAHHGIEENERVDALTRATFANFSQLIS